MFRTAGFKVFLDVLQKYFGTGGDSIIYTMSKEFGEEIIKSNIQNIPQSQDQLQAVMKILSNQYEKQGWGTIKDVNLDEGNNEISLAVANIKFDVNTLKEDSSVIYYMRGALAGILGALLKKELQVKSVEFDKPTKTCRFVYTIL